MELLNSREITKSIRKATNTFFFIIKQLISAKDTHVKIILIHIIKIINPGNEVSTYYLYTKSKTNVWRMVTRFLFISHDTHVMTKNG